uniref:Ig-like domain-containing protein n=1 Tax=Leptobrachium leishanense TaxID=445787 RepID=A0A8C5M961_9ANUR
MIKYYYSSLLTVSALHAVFCVYGESIQSQHTELSMEEGMTVTLSCTYTSSYTATFYLYWYQYYPNKTPNYILHKANQGTLSNVAPFAMGKFTSQVDSRSTNLTITDLKIEDSAMYLCALQRGYSEKGETQENFWRSENSRSK